MKPLNAQRRPNDGKVSQSVDSTKILRLDILAVTDRISGRLSKRFKMFKEV